MVEGEVGSAPQFSELRAGIPYGRFELRGANSSLEVVAPASFAMNLLPGYRVRVRGMLREVNGGYELELSQVAGEMRILERKSQSNSATAFPPMSVPVQALATIWSIAVDVAAIAAAAFSFVAMLPIVTSRRRYNVGLKITEYEPAYIEALPNDDRFELHLPLRLMPTRTLPPILKRRISLRINNEEIAEHTIKIAKIQPTSDFPLHVQAEVRLLLEATILRDRLSSTENRLIVTFKDDLCWRKFSAPFSIPSPSNVLPRSDSEMSIGEERTSAALPPLHPMQ
jgi:hypothetical protein